MNKGKSKLRLIFVGLMKNRTAAIGLFMVLFVVLSVLLAPIISPFNPNEVNFKNILAPPSSKHLLGTDGLGRDVLSRIIYGGRVSITVSVFTVSFATFFGIIIGLNSGYWGGRLDTYVMRVVDAFLAFPAFVLALAITAGLGFGMFNIIIAVGIAYTPQFCRLVRASALSVKEQPYIEAAKSMGVGHLKIIFSEILPNCLGPILVQAPIALAVVILTEAGLSFLGLGVQPPASSWGSMLADARDHLRDAPWIITYTGFAITITTLAVNLLGDGLRDALDPKLEARIR